jgi:putative flavoprotein involved in K+ transport
VIGAGPAGLAAAAALLRAGVSCEVLDRSPGPGGTYRRMHAGLRLLSPAGYNGLPGLETGWVPDEHVTAGRYREYLERYARELALPIRHGTEVVAVEIAEGRFVARTRDGKEFEGGSLVLATGMGDFPRPLDRSFDAPVQQALDWKGPEAYRGKTVLVVGSGTTAFELAAELSGVATVHLLTRDRPLRTFPETLAGINIHHLLALLERLPVSWFAAACEGRWKEPAVDAGVPRRIREGRIRWHRSPPAGIRFDAVISCAGYRFDTSILPAPVARTASGLVRTRANESVSHPGLFVIGHPCSGGADSKFLRGMRRDALRIAHRLQRGAKTLG